MMFYYVKCSLIVIITLALHNVKLKEVIDHLTFALDYVLYSRKVLTETGSRTTGLSFNVQVLYQLSYLNLYILLYYLDLKVALITRALYGAINGVSGRQGSHMYVGSYNLNNMILNYRNQQCIILAFVNFSRVILFIR